MTAAGRSIYNTNFRRSRQANALIGLISARRQKDLTRRVRRVIRLDGGSSRLRGRLLVVKDNICTSYRGSRLPTTCASGILQGFRATRDAKVLGRLLNQGGAVLMAKANMDEFGMGSHSIFSHYGPVVVSRGSNFHSAGGSSGGSAVAVLTHACFVALGTDTGGSVRLPAAYTSMVGFKPSYGRLSRLGVVPYANSLDTVGILARHIGAAAETFYLLNISDAGDPTCLSDSTRLRIGNKIRAQKSNLAPDAQLRIGVPEEYNIQEMSDSVREAWTRTLTLLSSLGYQIVRISLPATKHALSAYYVLAPAEASSNLAKYDGVRYGMRNSSSKVDNAPTSPLYASTRGKHLGSEVKRRIMLGAYSLSAEAIDNYFIQAQKVRRLVQRDFDSVFRMSNPLHDDSATHADGVDFIVCPTAPSGPPLLSELSKQGPLEAYVNDVFTVPASLAGLPAISVPAPPQDSINPLENEKYIGMQIIGQYGNDAAVLHLAKAAFQKHTWWPILRKADQSRNRFRSL